jgi:integrase
MPKLTKTLVENALPTKKPHFIWDSQQPGFGVKILPSGKRNYIVKYRNGGGRSARQRWYLVGTHGAITLDIARDMAKQVQAAVARGEDPQANKASFRESPTMNDLWVRFKSDHLARLKDRTADGYKQIWRLHVERPLGKMRVADITRDDVYRIHRMIANSPYQANRTVAMLSKMFNLAERWGMRLDGSNPCRLIEKYKEHSRERFLNAGEIENLGQSLREGLSRQEETPQMTGAIQLLLLTGARVSEILGAQWDWVDWERRVIELPDSKTGAKPIYLSEPAIGVLKGLQALPIASENPFIIPGRVEGMPLVNLRKPWGRIRARAGLDDVRIHDLRHTAASIAVSHGLGLPIVGRLLGHSQASTTQRYAHVDIDPALAAANQIGETVSKALGLDVVRADAG